MPRPPPTPPVLPPAEQPPYNPPPPSTYTAPPPANNFFAEGGGSTTFDAASISAPGPDGFGLNPFFGQNPTAVSIFPGRDTLLSASNSTTVSAETLHPDISTPAVPFPSASVTTESVSTPPSTIVDDSVPSEPPSTPSYDV